MGCVAFAVPIMSRPGLVDMSGAEERLRRMELLRCAEWEQRRS